MLRAQQRSSKSSVAAIGLGTASCISALLFEYVVSKIRAIESMLAGKLSLCTEIMLHPDCHIDEVKNVVNDKR